MPLTSVQTKTNVSSVAVASLAAVFTSPPTQGNLIVAAANSDATLTMTSSGFTAGPFLVNATGLYLWFKSAGASESSTVTVTPGVTASTELWIAEYSGNAVTPFDASASGSDATNAATIPSGTTAATAQADELAIAAFGWSDATGVETADSYSNSFTEVVELKGLGGTATNLAVATLALAATGAQSTTATLSSNISTTRGGVIATFKASAGGAPVVSPLQTFGPSYAAHRAASI